MLLNELDRRGRVRGAAVCELDEALEFLRELAEQEFGAMRTRVCRQPCQPAFPRMIVARLAGISSADVRSER